MRRLATTAALLAAAASLCSAAESRDIRFVLDRSSSSASGEAALGFKALVEKETRGRVRVEVLTPEEYKEKFNGGRGVGKAVLLARVASGKLEMCETSAGTAGPYHHALWVLAMPYLFSGEPHVEAVLGGPIGKTMLDALLESSRKRGALRGLGFTVDGFSVVASADANVRAVKDLAGLRLLVPADPMSQALARKLGAEQIAAPAEAFLPLVREDLADAASTTFAEFDEDGFAPAARTILAAEHSLSVGLFVINDAFFQSLSEKDRAAVSRAGEEAARAQRLASAKANEAARAKAAAAGVMIIGLSAEEKERLKEPLMNVLADVGALLGIHGQDVIESIEGADPARAR